jgi:hypothetical protein
MPRNNKPDVKPRKSRMELKEFTSSNSAERVTILPMYRVFLPQICNKLPSKDWGVEDYLALAPLW